MAVIGLGNALMDILINIESEQIIDDLKLANAGMTMIDIDTHKHILALTEALPHSYTAGGSAANTMTGIARLGGTAGFIGKVGRDDTGERFVGDLRSNGITPHVEISESDPSGKCISLVHPCGERTMATFLGAAITMTPSSVTEQMLHGYKVLYVEGYLAYNQPLVEEAMALAQRMGVKVALDLSSYNVVEDNIEFINHLTDKYIDIIFANQEEAAAFTGSTVSDVQSAQKVLEMIASRCEVAVVKIGASGALVAMNGVRYHVGVLDTIPIDKTGAGDLFASGFLWGYCHGYSAQVCAQLGAILSSKVIEVMGPKVTDNQWDAIMPMVKNVVAGEDHKVDFVYL